MAVLYFLNSRIVICSYECFKGVYKQPSGKLEPDVAGSGFYPYKLCSNYHAYGRKKINDIISFSPYIFQFSVKISH